MDPIPLAVVLLVDPRGWVLLQERDEGAPRAADQWGMVGGHVEDGEDFEPAAYRELLEETGVSLPPGTLHLWRDAEYTYPDGLHGRYHLYAAAVDLTDALDLAPSTRHFLPEFLDSDLYRSLRRTR
jgi:8-oxo-dGTP pyrophosphatase MutT (NUDIX family)